MTSLRTRLLIAVGVVVIASVATVSLAVRQSARHEFLRFQETERHSAAAGHAATLEVVARELDGTCCSRESLARAASRLDADGALFVFDASGRPLVASAGPALRGARDVVARHENTVLLVELSRPDPRGGVNRVSLHFETDGAPVTLADGRHGIVFVLSLPLHDVPAVNFLVALDLRLFWATILVERESQKPIVIGRGGEMIKEVGTSARHAIETFLQNRVFLDLRVAVKEQWREDERLLDQLGMKPDPNP